MIDNLKTTKVLVVDDHAPSRETLRFILEESRYQVAEAQDGEQAVAMVRQSHFDIVLLDVVMPEMDGFTACQKIVDVDPRAKIIFLTGHNSTDLVSLALKAEVFSLLTKSSVRRASEGGGFSLLSKPVDPEDMLTLIQSVIGSAQRDAASTKKSKNH